MEIVLSNEQQAIAEQKRTAWGNFGAGIYTTEIQLKSMADIEKNNLSVLPKNIFEVPEAEARLAAGKKMQNSIIEKRKEITSRFDELTKRLMAFEKSLTPAIESLASEIIKIKKADETEKKNEKAKSDELIRCTEFCQNEAIRMDTLLKNKVLDFVSRCYNKALESNLNPSDIKDYISKSKGAVTDKSFAYVAPVFHNAYISREQITEIATKHFVIDQQSYVKSFCDQIDEKFSDYDVAFYNKAQALANSKKEEEDKKKEIDQLAKQQQVSNNIVASAATSTPTQFYTKALKKSYEIDMEETIENALTIIAAFSANLTLCMKHVRVSKWFGFSATQAGNALAKVKCEDNEFNPVGITFKEVEKL